MHTNHNGVTSNYKLIERQPDYHLSHFRGDESIPAYKHIILATCLQYISSLLVVRLRFTRTLQQRIIYCYYYCTNSIDWHINRAIPPDVGTILHLPAQIASGIILYFMYAACALHLYN